MRFWDVTARDRRMSTVSLQTLAPSTEPPPKATPSREISSPNRVLAGNTKAYEQAAARMLGSTPPVVVSAPTTSKPEPVNKTLVIFGATGNLTSIKLIPALLRLESAKLLDSAMRIVGTS